MRAHTHAQRNSHKKGEKKKKEALPFVTTWMTPEGTVRTQRDKHRMIARVKPELTERTGTKNRLVVARGGE